MRTAQMTLNADRTVTIGTKSCSCTWMRDGEFAGQEVGFNLIPCTKCKGTGKRGNGRCSNCNSRHAYKPTPGQVTDYTSAHAVGPCRTCNGTLVEAANYCDNAPLHILDAMQWKLVGVAREQTGLEHTLGVHPGFMRNTLWTCTDYGRTVEALAKGTRTVSSFLDEIRTQARDRTQLVHLLDDEATDRKAEHYVLNSHVVVIVTRNGYSVVSMTPKTEMANI